MSIRAVLDTNIVISILLGIKDTPPRQIYQALKKGLFISVISEAIIQEIEDVVSREHIRKLLPISEDEVEQFVAEFVRISAIVPSTINTILGLSDPDDNMIIACALTGQANYIVTGDKKHLLPLKEYEGIKIVTALTFLEMLNQ